MAAKILANLIVMGGGILARAVVTAYRQALTNREERMEQRTAALEKLTSEQGRWIAEMRADITGLKLDLKEIKEMLRDIKKGDKMSEGGEKSVKADKVFLKESLQDLKEIKELLQDIKKGDRMSEGGEKSVNDEEKKTQDVGEGSDMKNHIFCSEEKTKNEVRFARETEMIRAEGDASIKKVKTMCYNDLFLERPIIELSSKKVEGGDATKHHFFPNSDLLHKHKKSLWDQDLIMKVARTSMTSKSWNFNLLGAETFIQNPLSFPPPPKPPDLNLHAVANGFPPYDRQNHNTFRKRK